ncbi:MAG: hypothetical protein AAF141_10490 [Pseudomonadota bacterium]
MKMSALMTAIATGVTLAALTANAHASAKLVPLSDLAKAAVAKHFQECDGAVLEGDDEPEPTEYKLTLRYSTEDQDAEPSAMRLVEYMCFRGAYNFGFVYLLGAIDEEPLPVQFAVPEVDVIYGKTDDGEEDFETVERIDMVGFSTQPDLINPSFKLETMTLQSYSKFRGVGDAFSSGTWSFRNGHFVLVGYAMDASLDGEQNPQLDVTFGPPFDGPGE